MAEIKTVNLEVNSNLAKTEQAVTSLKSELRKAQAEVASLSDKFGATSKEAIEAAKRAAELKDRIGDAKALTDAFNPENKFKALAGAANIAAGALSGFEGVMALVGAQSEEAQQAILKVQGALALSQGIEQLQTIPDTFKNIKAVAIDAFKGIKNAIGSTGIGLLVVALGTVYAYWDDIKAAVSGVSEQQKKLNAESKKNLEQEQEKLKAIGNQDEILKLQGKSESEILKMKIKQTDETMAAAKIDLQRIITTNEQQQKAVELNYKYLKSFIDFISIPQRFLFETAANAINKIIDLINKIPGVEIKARIDEKFAEKASDYVAKLGFDPAKVKAEGEKTVKEAKLNLQNLENEKARYQNNINSIDKKAAEDAILTEEEKKKKLKELNDEYNKKLREEEPQAIDTTDLQSAQDKLNADAQFKEDQLSAEQQHQLKISQIIYDSETERNKREEKARQEKLEKFQATTEAIGSIAQSGEELLSAIQANGLARGKAGQAAMKALALVQIGADSAIAFSKMLQGTESSAAGAASVAGPAAPAVYTATKIAFYASGTATILANLARARALLSGGSASSGGAKVSSPSVGSAAAPSFNVVGNSGVNQIAQTMSNQNQSPIQAFVVAQNVTTAQGLNRAIINNASLG